ncbi:MAG: hypothetical protein OXG87_11240 [Gemmatimonadetes bacterium]|nr:hypothetical protein [Gemmatimonadota bacterium]
MDTFTIYLDTEDPRRTKLFVVLTIVLAINCIYQGWQQLSDAHHTFDWITARILLLGGITIIVAIIVTLCLPKKFGRPRVVFSNEGLEIKAKRRGHAKKISWDEIQAMHLKINGVEIIPKAQPAHPIEIPAGTCSYTQFQQIKKNLKEYSAEYHVESNF